ncbi:MAG: 50S ribosomal protein L28 [Chloroflexi bacterium]|nr:50S ribosomal protein L28 [Chloroflexota bacterium]
MSGRCELCGKTATFGNAVSHAKRHTRRVWRPNLRYAVIQQGGAPRQVRICTRCLRTQRKAAA